MKIPLHWLNEFVAVPWSARELGDKLTMAGFELEAISPVSGTFSDVVVAEIVSAEKHPQADTLQVCRVNVGVGEALQIVCGAANARAGLRTALARVGAELPGGLKIKAAKLRGSESQGMLCSQKELGLAETSDGILELPADAPLGVALQDYLQLDDVVLELNITPNRGDAMSVLGVAREVAALSGGGLRAASTASAAVASGQHAPGPKTLSDARWPVRVVATAACPLFLTRVIEGLDNRRGLPLWLRERLRRAGLRSISPIVDVTNYVLHELGQPMHAYDRAKLDRELIVRQAATDESIVLLDGRTVALQNDVLVIADASGPVGMAGILGGQRTAVSADTTQVVLEVAFFTPAAIAGRARRVGLSTDASQRFERGVDFSSAHRALERASELLLQTCGGRAGPVQEQSEPASLPKRPAVTLRRQQLHRLLGVAFPDSQVSTSLTALQLLVTPTYEGWSVQPPAHRFDLAIEEDLIEEVARIVGYGQIPEQAARLTQVLRSLPESQANEVRIADALAARGWYETIHFAFVDPAVQGALFPHTAALALRNPIASDLAVMRVSLWSGLLKSVRDNLRHQQDGIKLFEFGSVFIEGAEVSRLAGAAAGLRSAEQWAEARAGVDFYDVAADLDSILAAAGDAVRWSYRPETLDCLHPGRSARILRDGQAVGWIGELHPERVRQLDMTDAPVVFELDLQPAFAVALPQFRDFSRFPSMRRDLAVVVDDDVTFAAMHERVTLAASSLLKSIRVFDIYRGSGIENGRKSIAIGLIFQDDSRTLTDTECDQEVAAVRADLGATLNAKIRE